MLLDDHDLRFCQDWVRHLVAERHLGRSWGYAVFYSPEVISEGLLSVQAAHKRLLDLALVAVGADEGTTGMRFRLQQLPSPEDWSCPAGHDDDDEVPDCDSTAEGSLSDHLAESSMIDVSEAGDMEGLVGVSYLSLSAAEHATCAWPSSQDTESKDEEMPKPSYESEDERTLGSDSTRSTDELAEDNEPEPERPIDTELDLSEDEDPDMRNDADIDLVTILPKLRGIFAGSTGASESPDLLEGLLSNVFLVINEDSAESFAGDKPADNAWVWAIDPAYDSASQADPATVHGLRDVYQGYMRVRLQQLVNHFYEACRFRHDLTLRDLWTLTSNEAPYDFAFVKYEPGFEFSFDHDIGSELVPEKRDGQTVNVMSHV